MDEQINLSEWYSPSEATAVINKNSSITVKNDYIRKLASYGKVRRLKISERASLYCKEDVDKYRAVGPGARKKEKPRKAEEESR